MRRVIVALALLAALGSVAAAANGQTKAPVQVACVGGTGGGSDPCMTDLRMA